MGPIDLKRLLSWLWPVRLLRTEGRHGPLEVRWEYGRKVLNSVHGNQSFGSLHRVLQGAFARMELHLVPPSSVLLLGLGGGSAVWILRRELGINAPIKAIEIDPVMAALARHHFGLDAFTSITVIEGDAIIQVQALRERFDLVVVDLFDDLDMARGVDTSGFIHALRDRCNEGGTVCFNTVSYDPESGIRCQRVHDLLLRVFNSVEEFRSEDINRVFIARG
jgi:spermidine synthase